MKEQNDVIIYRSKDGRISVALMTRDRNVWLNQIQIATLFGTSKQNIGQHIATILRERELDADSVAKNYFTTAADGKSYDTLYYSLQMVIAVGFRVRGIRGTQFRQWAHISNSDMEKYVEGGYSRFDSRRKKYEAEMSDAEDLMYLDELENEIKNR